MYDHRLPFQWKISPPPGWLMPTAQTSLADTTATELSHPGAEGKAGGTAGLTVAAVLAVAPFRGVVVVAGAAPDSARHATTPHPASARAGTQLAIVRIAGSFRFETGLHRAS